MEFVNDVEFHSIQMTVINFCDIFSTWPLDYERQEFRAHAVVANIREYSNDTIN